MKKVVDSKATRIVCLKRYKQQKQVSYKMATQTGEGAEALAAVTAFCLKICTDPLIYTIMFARLM